MYHTNIDKDGNTIFKTRSQGKETTFVSFKYHIRKPILILYLMVIVYFLPKIKIKKQKENTPLSAFVCLEFKII